MSEPHCLRLQNDLAPVSIVKLDTRRHVGLDTCSYWLLQPYLRSKLLEQCLSGVT